MNEILRPAGSIEDRDDCLIRRFVDADRSPAELAAELGLTLRELAAWGREPANVAALRSMARLSDIRAQMLLSHYRAVAAANLIKIAADGESSELARKACVDLLDADLDAFDMAGEPAPVPPGPSEEAILRTLEEIGRLEELEQSS